jgi:thiosulfate dehydrogenase
MGKFFLFSIFALAIATSVWMALNTHTKEKHVEVAGGMSGARYYEIDDPHDDKPPLRFDLLDPECAPADMLNKILYGYQIMLETKKHAPEYARNGLDCNCCHFNGGNTLGGKNRGISLVGVTAMYPKYSKRDKKNISLFDRLNNCFKRSMNGNPLPVGCIEAEALEAYLAWISHEVMDAPSLPWLGLDPIPSNHFPDIENGQKVYVHYCQICHGTDGEGSQIAPPVWGPNSFNDGAGMNTMPMLSTFVWLNMPHGQPVLTPEEALDVAAYVISKPRPHFVP